MKRIAIVTVRAATETEPEMTAPAEPFPDDAVVIRGDIEPGYYLCYQPGDELPPPPVL